jgi:hypothetical protein
MQDKSAALMDSIVGSLLVSFSPDQVSQGDV